MNAAIPDLLVFIDVICPWCLVGKRRLERALTLIGQETVRVRWMPFELNPDMPKDGMDRRAYRTRKFGSWERSEQLDAQMTEMGESEGISFHFDLMARTPNTFNAHRLIWWLRPTGGQDALVEGLFRAYFTEGRDIGSQDVLRDLAVEAGMEREAASAFLQGDEGALQVSQEEEVARRAGLSGVPAFILNRRPLLVGAHPPEIIASALRRAMDAPAGAHA
ncbi:MAG TPA: DsbA family oxidoreductase [Micropepsaceae bacterium]|jgi:predicted DsbA family dithiol-disulfide isomerase|nr:DsbA family oxidoreductase [Micropepsaceae bacterium]